MRREFPAKVKKLAWRRALGFCDGCGGAIAIGNGPEYDHDIPDALGGEPTVENCVVLCIPCHRAKTVAQDRPAITKSHRLERKSANITGRKAIIAGSKESKWKRKINGETVLR